MYVKVCVWGDVCVCVYVGIVYDVCGCVYGVHV